MAPSQFEAAVRREHAVAVIDLEGEINATADSALDAAYTEATGTDPAAILLNFEAVEYINSTGIALIVGLLARARKERRTITAYGLTEHYREIFQITRLSDFMSIFPDEASAVGSVPATAG
jgi:anti-sigma B factor antagonist